MHAEPESSLQQGVQTVVVNLLESLLAFRNDTRWSRLVEQDIPDARQRLTHVVRLTSTAAHQTMDLIDECRHLSGSMLSHVATLQGEPAAKAGLRIDIDTLRARLGDMLTAQGFQDVSGQIIQSVMKLIEELESSLVVLARLSGVAHTPSGPDANDIRPSGPMVPGVLQADSAVEQTDVDALLSGLGM
jgi:chemotaxis protein CheZ